MLSKSICFTIISAYRTTWSDLIWPVLALSFVHVTNLLLTRLLPFTLRIPLGLDGLKSSANYAKAQQKSGKSKPQKNRRWLGLRSSFLCLRCLQAHRDGKGCEKISDLWRCAKSNQSLDYPTSHKQKQQTYSSKSLYTIWRLEKVASENKLVAEPIPYETLLNLNIRLGSHDVLETGPPPLPLPVLDTTTNTVPPSIHGLAEKTSISSSPTHEVAGSLISGSTTEVNCFFLLILYITK